MIRRRSTPAFTLFEAILALALTVLLLGAVFSFVSNLGRRREAMGAATAEARRGEAVLDHLEADLTAAIAGDARAGAGLIGASSEVAVLTRRVWLSGGIELQRARYRFDAAAGVIRASRAGAGDPELAPDVLADRVQRLRVRYFDGRVWRQQFDSAAAGRLPAAVEIALWMGAPRQRAAASEPPPSLPPDFTRVVAIPDAPASSGKESP